MSASSVRAVSPHAKFSIQLIEAPVKRGPDGSGTIVEWQEGKPVIAEFRQTGLYNWEQIAALEKFNFGGVPEGVNPLSTLSVYDPEAMAIQNNWSPDFLETVIERLKVLAVLNPGSFIVVEAPAKAPPWKSYDSQDVASILDVWKATGTDQETVRLYETENANRDEILDVAERLGAGESWDDISPEPAPEPVQKEALFAAPIVSGVAGTANTAPAKTGIEKFIETQEVPAGKLTAPPKEQPAEGKIVDA